MKGDRILIIIMSMNVSSITTYKILQLNVLLMR